MKSDAFAVEGAPAARAASSAVETRLLSEVFIVVFLSFGAGAECAPPAWKVRRYRKSSGIDRFTSTSNSSVGQKLQRQEKGENFFVAFFPYRPQRFGSHLAPHLNLARHRPKASSRSKKTRLPIDGIDSY